MTSSIASTLAPLFAELETERALSDAIRDKAKELDRCYRALSSLLNSVHSTKGDQLPLLVQQAIPLLQEARIRISELGMLVPEGGYYRFCDDYAFPLRGLVSSIALIVLLSMGALATKAEVEKVLGINSSSTRVQLSTEDYLHGTINMINDLPRLAVNSVTLGDFRTPLRLAKVTKEIHAAFQLLNLKNDSLRKRFDGIKYDVKRVEEVVYDISLRGLAVGEDTGEGGVAYPKGEEERLRLVDTLSTSQPLP